MGYLPQHSLENLKKYSYKAVDKSLLSRYVLNPFWTWFVTLWPVSVAPNTITLTGLSIVFFNFFTLIYYDPLYLTERDGENVGPPQWVYYTWGIGLFAYQSLDAIDGKQARRTGMAGPLGEMFDHGCDALNTTLEVILASRALGLGRSWWTVASQIATLANFYLTTWEEYHTAKKAPPASRDWWFRLVFSTSLAISGNSFSSNSSVEKRMDIDLPFRVSRIPLWKRCIFLQRGGSRFGSSIKWESSNFPVWYRASLFRGRTSLAPVWGSNGHFLYHLNVFRALCRLSFQSQLFLGYFSGPVEGIIMIVVIYLITGYYGTGFWEQRIWTFTGLSRVPLINKLPNLPLNEAFMVFGAFGLAFNIITSYMNVRRAAKALKRSQEQFHTPPLLLLLPFLFTALLQIAWLSHPKFDDSYIIDSAAFVPFLCAWGLQFAHMVGRMILAHVTGGREEGRFPIWDWVWVWSVIGAVDANLPLLGIAPIIQRSQRHTSYFVWLTLIVSFVAYARFVTLVIGDITNYLGIACFTVRKKDEKGVWRDAVPTGDKRQ
ncbi:hypothetical protein D9613_004532 [Agrocybe pediades]|uniref:Choline/ethanolaminephosphotransferase n=1 Tax=Agrocybe pediades TaxID=84607 RepID=A0A8H4QJN8_9AGAR|nr:hypothetical protein D9613_004532 [Agrocybe pediades]